MMTPVLALDLATHWVIFADVQRPSLVRFSLYPFVIASPPKLSEVRLGTKYRVESLTNVLFDESVVHSN